MGFRRPSKNNVPTVENRSAGGDFMRGLMADIERGIVIPIISNAMRIEQIFRDEQSLLEQLSDTADRSVDGPSFEELMTKDWADTIGYPMGDDSNLPRVAQYYELEIKEALQAKTNYLRFVANYFLDGIGAEAESPWRRKGNFSQLINEMDYPTFPQGMEDPLRSLAKLPFKIYITTSFYDFIEQALTAEDKEPQTEVCFWSRKTSDGKDENKLDLSKFTDKKPLVYHLFGLEDFPDTMVLSEDDYMNFLISVVQDTDNKHPVVPLELRAALANWRLLLLGYRLRYWDFRVLFRFIQTYRDNAGLPRGMLIQLRPSSKPPKDNAESYEKRSVEYLSQYFDRKQFNVDWTSSEKFIQKLAQTWDKYRKGQL
jgi:SIR2-like domain